MFQLFFSPGVGGISSGKFGGGAGGILVNRKGASGDGFHDGEGYGSGGSSSSGLPGVVLLSFS